jgi:uncharacterized protein YndB with AHSA1/START domain
MDSDVTAGLIEKKVLIQAAPGVIFRALTESKDLAQWFCDRATCEPKVGGELKAFWRTGNGNQPQRGRAIFTEVVPDKKVELDWVEEDGPQVPGRHLTSYTISMKRETSELLVRDQGPPFSDDESQEILSQGWISVLRDLKEHCEARQRSTRRRVVGSTEETQD